MAATQNEIILAEAIRRLAVQVEASAGSWVNREELKSIREVCEAMSQQTVKREPRAVDQNLFVGGPILNMK